MCIHIYFIIQFKTMLGKDEEKKSEGDSVGCCPVLSIKLIYLFYYVNMH